MTQCDELLQMLRTQGELGVTPLEALHALGVFRLAARVYDLKAQGHDIVADEITLRSGARIARYRLVEQPEQLQAFA